ncbi:alpha/beta hydrolase [Paenibacillus sp. sptzw28]|uniref:alpha/beta fold hydrolase n=1 Tax=Paenibacillus sp. sptzw28 TaxID=715179 RepID=UPI001C6EC2B1|nr:alpha/beta hydrolase [Paenibacillus sp. sptzw28]QYR22547.1 alpha/beta hydrolase [Paenibacillus sp. sptzw28]
MNSIGKNKIQTAYGTMEYAKSGEGTPAVILINGGSGPIEGWFKIFHEIAEQSTVVAYNRFGVGGSQKPAVPQHGQAVVDSLRELLREIGVNPPYILVGHSLGGLYANLFARQYSDEIAGVVLLESSHPKDLTINETQPPFIRRLNQLLGIFDSFSPHRKWNEVHYVEETINQLAQSAPFPEVPLFVVSGGKKPPMMPESAFAIRKENQLDFVRLNQRGTHLIADSSGHFPQLSEPEIVLRAIRECIHTVRNMQR